MKNIRWIVLCGTLTMYLTLGHVHADAYTVIRLGDIPGGPNISRAHAINNLGQITGESITTGSGYWGAPGLGIHAFLWDAENGMQDLGELPGGEDKSGGSDINENGIIVGGSVANSTTHHRAMRWTADQGMRDLGTMPGGYPYYGASDVNNSGQISGSTWNYSGSTGTALIWDNGQWNALGDLPGGAFRSWGEGINEAGTVVGIGNAATGDRAFIWDAANGMRDLGDLPGGENRSAAFTINDLGQVAGYSGTTNGLHAFIWDESNGMIDLGVLNEGPEEYSNAKGINQLGQVVGSSTAADGEQHAFIWDAQQGMLDLNTLIPTNSGFQILNYAADINDLGQIVGTGINANGDTEAFLLTPIPEPASLAMIGLFGGSAFFIRRWFVG